MPKKRKRSAKKKKGGNYKQFNTNKLDSPKEMNKFLETYNI